MKCIVTVIRQVFTKDSTIGEMLINGKHFCWTLEDFDRDKNRDGDIDDPGEEKVYGETAIPSGIYNIKLTMSPHFKRITPEILNVKGYGGVRIHGGNSKVDTLGCVLVAYNKGTDRIQGTAEKDLTNELKKYNEIQLIITYK